MKPALYSGATRLLLEDRTMDSVSAKEDCSMSAPSAVCGLGFLLTSCADEQFCGGGQHCAGHKQCLKCVRHC